MNKKIVIGIITVIIILVAGLGFWRWENARKAEISKQQQEADLAAKNAEGNKVEDFQNEKIDTSDWKTYRDEKYKFEIKYPESWHVINEGASGFGGESISVLPKEKDDLNLIFHINKRFEKNYFEWIKSNINPLIGKDHKMEIFGDALMNNYIYAWNVLSSDYEQSYKTNAYFVSDKKSIIYFSFEEINKGKNYESFSPIFKAMVNSIRFFD